MTEIKRIAEVLGIVGILGIEGFETGLSALQYLIKNCGLRAANTPELDITPGQSRPAVQAVKAIGDTVTYIELTGFENEPLSYIDAVTGLTVNTTWDASAQFLIPINGFVFLTTSQSSVDYYLDPTFRQSNGKYPLTTEVGNEPIYAQQFSSPITPTEIILTEESLADTTGWTEADGTQTEDAAGLIPYGVGELIPNFLDSNISIGYLNGEHFIADNFSRINYDRRIVDGDVDSLTNTDNWDVDALSSILSDRIRQVGGGADRADLNSNSIVNVASKVITIVVEILAENFGGTDFICRGGVAGAILTSDVSFPTTVGIHKMVATVKPGVVSGDKIKFVLIGGTGTFIEYNVFIYEGDLTATALPTSGSWESDNSIIWADKYNGIYKYDLTDISSDHLLGTNKVQTYNDMQLTTNDQQFASEDKQQILFYEAPISGECLNKTLKYLELALFLLDEQGNFILDETEDKILTDQ